MYSPPPFEVIRTEGLALPFSSRELLTMPSALYIAGDERLLSSTVRRVAIIGTRKPTELGRARVRRLVRELVRENICIVSGLAEGIDTEAHQAAIREGGKTMAVVGLPLDRVYPKKNSSLQEYIGREHLLVSQFEPGVETHPSFFVQRNRTMALLSDATVIIEAGDSSGTLSQAAETVRNGKPLFILKSALDRPDLQWPARFVKRGAIVLTDSNQII